MALIKQVVKPVMVAIFVLALATSAVVLTFARSGATDTQKSNAQKGPSGLPLPRFVSLKFDRVNVRKGPSVTHKVAWVFNRKGLPVEIIAEFDHWRRVRDSEGEEGWVYFSLLTGKRTALVTPWRKSGRIELFNKPKGGKPIAVVEAGALGDVDNCTGKWCRFAAKGLQGWVKQDLLWGVYPGEHLN